MYNKRFVIGIIQELYNILYNILYYTILYTIHYTVIYNILYNTIHYTVLYNIYTLQYYTLYSTLQQHYTTYVITFAFGENVDKKCLIKQKRNVLDKCIYIYCIYIYIKIVCIKIVCIIKDLSLASFRRYTCCHVAMETVSRPKQCSKSHFLFEDFNSYSGGGVVMGKSRSHFPTQFVKKFHSH